MSTAAATSRADGSSSTSFRKEHRRKLRFADLASSCVSRPKSIDPLPAKRRPKISANDQIVPRPNDNMTGACPHECRLSEILKAKADKDSSSSSSSTQPTSSTLPQPTYSDCRPIFVAISQGDVARVKALLSDPMLRVQNITHGGLTPIEFAMAICMDDASTATVCSILRLLKEAGITIRRGLYQLDYKIDELSAKARCQLFSALAEVPTEYHPDAFDGYPTEYHPDAAFHGYEVKN